MNPCLTWMLLPALLIPGLAAAAQPAPETVRIYRCVASSGQIALQDKPCRSGSEQVIERQRPKDPPPPTVAAPAAPPPAPPQVITRVVQVSAPPALYACTTDSGQRYTSDDGEGNPRWVAGLPVLVSAPGLPHHGRPQLRPPRPGAGQPLWPPGPPAVLVGAAGYWLRDSCQRMPREQACTQLSAERWQLISRYNSALQSERTQLLADQRQAERRMGEQQCAQ